MRTCALSVMSLLALLLVAGCSAVAGDRLDPARTAGSGPASNPTAGPATASPVAPPPMPTTPPPSATPTLSPEQATLATMSLKQKVGQLFMVGGAATGPGEATRDAITKYHVGNVMLTGRSGDGVKATAKIVDGLKKQVSEKSTSGVPLFVATDQEGGTVQVLKGPGFSTMPSALQQGKSGEDELRKDAQKWGGQLRSAGVNVNLGPVVDTVPSASAAPGNAPIGAFRRQFGYTVDRVAGHGTAFAQGMTDAGVLPTIKHFPGLGRVRGNTDVSSGVTDHATTRNDEYLEPFRRGIQAGAPLVMMSTAYYSKIDAKNPAVFSEKIITGMLRGDLGFRGVVISDDVGAARQLSGFKPGTRATRFIDAGGDIVLTVEAGQIPAMVQAVIERAEEDDRFAAKVDAAVLRVLTAKADLR